MRFFAVVGNSCLALSRVFDNVLVDESEIFVNFCIKRGVRMGPKFKPSLSTDFSESESGKFSGMETTHHSFNQLFTFLAMPAIK